MITLIRRRKDAADRSPRIRRSGRAEDFLLSFMGPPQLGLNQPPEGYVPDDAANFCRKCDQRWEAHERVHTGTMTYRRCPQG